MTAPTNVRDLLSRRWGVPLVTQAEQPISVIGLTPVTFLRQNPARVGFIAVNLGASPVFIQPAHVPTVVTGFDPEVSATQGIRLEANGGGAILNWEQDGEMVAWEWRGVVSAGTTTLIVFEIALDKGRVVPQPAAPIGG